MSDLISRQAAIDAATYGNPQTAWQRIEALPSVQPERWIPCSERLPEKDGYYLTTTMYYQVYRDYWNGDNWDRTEMIIAWMPLPEPFKGAQT